MLKSEKRSIKTADFICPEEKKHALKPFWELYFCVRKHLQKQQYVTSQKAAPTYRQVDAHIAITKNA